MAQQGPNPIELYEGAVNYMRPILAGVTSIGIAQIKLNPPTM